VKDLFKKIKLRYHIKLLRSQGPSRKFIFLPLLVLVLIGVFLIAEPALADVGSFVASVFGWLIMQIVSILGKILTWIIGLLIEIAQYNSFITAPAVSKGWIIVRDVCNMFFIAALLLIAFGTVLKIEKYSYKRTLGGLLVAAVLINFSKFICGFFIDIAQILMLTFVNAFKDAGSGNFLQMLGMDKWLNFSGAQSAAGGSALTGALFALILVVISLIVISIMMIILAFRIVMIWLLVVLSPLVFVLNVFPGKMKSYSNMWWDKFTNQLIVGPVMAFFIWLSFAVANQSSIVPQTSVDFLEGTTTETKIVLSDNSVSEAANPSNFAKFVVSIAMLVGSLLIAQQLGVAGGKIAGKAVGKMQAYATGQAGILKKVKDKAKVKGKVAMGIGKGLAGGAVAGLGKSTLELGKKFPVLGVGIKGIEKGIKGFKNWKADTIKSLETKRKERAKEISEKGDAAGFFTKVFNSFDRNFDKFGKKDRSVGRLAQAQRVKDTQDGMQDKSEEELRVLAKMGSAVEKMAAAILLAQRGFLKGNTVSNRDIIKIAQSTMASNPILRNQFTDHIKKTSDADLIAEIEYNNFENEADARRFKSDVNEGKIDLVKVIPEMDSKKLDDLIKNSGGKFGEMVIQSLSGNQISDLGAKMRQTPEGEANLDKIFDKNVFNAKNFEDEEHALYDPRGAKRLQYFKATGRLDDLYSDPAKLKEFLEHNEGLVGSNLSKESLGSTEFFRVFAKTMSPEFIKKMSAKTGFKEIIDSSWEAVIKENNETPEKIHTPEAKKIRKEYVKYKKGENIDAIYAGIEGTDDKSKADRERISHDLSKDIADNEINVKQLADLDAETLERSPEIGRAILKAADFGFLKEYTKKMSKDVKKKLGEILYEMEQDETLGQEERDHATELLEKFTNTDSSLVPKKRRIRKEAEAEAERKKKEAEAEAAQKKKDAKVQEEKDKRFEEDSKMV